MRNHLESDGNCNNVNLQFPQKNLQEMKSIVGLTCSVGGTTPRFTISIEQQD